MPNYPPGDNDVTVLLKPQSGSRRWQHISEHLDPGPAARAPPMQGSRDVGAAGAAAERQRPASSSGRSSPVERNYTVILGSHRNKCLKFEKDGELCCMVCGGPNVCCMMSVGYTWRLSRGAIEVGAWLDVLDGPVSGRVESHARTLPPYSTTHPVTYFPDPSPCTSQVENVPGATLPATTFTRYWINYEAGSITVGTGEPGPSNAHYCWTDPDPIEDIRYAALSAWDKHVAYRNIRLQAALDLRSAAGTHVGGGKVRACARGVRNVCESVHEVCMRCA